MDRQARSAIWTDLTDSDAVTSVLSSYGLTPDVESTSARHDETGHPLVQRESDLAFVRRLARRNGYAFWVTSAASVATAHFRSLPVGDQPAVTLTVNRTPPHLDGLDVTWDTERPTSVEALQLDLLTKEDIDGAAPQPPLTSLGKDDLGSITGDTRSMYLAAPADDAGDLRARADGALVESSFFVRATGSTTRERVGRPVRAHTVVRIDGAGSRHSGSYLVAGVRHTVDEGGHRMDLELLRNGWGA
jgi:phage protein D